jgi:hypothetical protein
VSLSKVRDTLVRPGFPRGFHRLYRKVDQLSDQDQQALVIVLDSLVKRSRVKRVMGE